MQPIIHIVEGPNEARELITKYEALGLRCVRSIETPLCFGSSPVHYCSIVIYSRTENAYYACIPDGAITQVVTSVDGRLRRGRLVMRRKVAMYKNNHGILEPVGEEVEEVVNTPSADVVIGGGDFVSISLVRGRRLVRLFRSKT